MPKCRLQCTVDICTRQLFIRFPHPHWTDAKYHHPGPKPLQLDSPALSQGKEVSRSLLTFEIFFDWKPTAAVGREWSDALINLLVAKSLQQWEVPSGQAEVKRQWAFLWWISNSVSICSSQKWARILVQPLSPIIMGPCHLWKTNEYCCLL